MIIDYHIAKMKVLLFLILSLQQVQRHLCITGFHFKDNLSKSRFTSDNGNLTFRIPNWPKHLG